MKTALIALGSNLGDSIATLQNAVQELQHTDGIIVKKVSSFYKTPPIGGVVQDDFINACALIETKLTPKELMQVLLNIEQIFKRKRVIRWGPRTLDLDLIDYAGLKSDDSFVTLPHPRAYLRAFVLLPASEIAPHLKLGGEKTISEYLALLNAEDLKGITKLNYA